MMNEKEYYDLEPGESQYDDLDITQPVPARYIHGLSSAEQGNPLIEALPPQWEGNDTIRRYSKGITGFNASTVKDMNRREKIALVRQFRNIRLALPFQQLLEDEFNSALVSSYSMRRQQPVDDAGTVCITEGKTYKPGYVLWGEPEDPTFGYFSLTGFGGIGKSTAIQMLLSHYPQVIFHEDEKGNYTQIVYLVVSCVGYSNFSALYTAVGRAIDHALHNTSHEYEKEIARARNLGAKSAKVMELIELFSIGIIIFDEIQMLDFSPNKENSFVSLLTLMNNTKVAIAVVGTEEARDKMFSGLHTSRRTGTQIDGNEYCTSKRFFKLLVESLFRYQLFDTPVEVTDDIVDSLYNHSKGIVDMLVTLYSRINLDYINQKKKPEVNGEYISLIAEKYYPGIQHLLEMHDYDALLQLNEQVKKEMDGLFADEIKDQQEQMDLIAARSGELAEEQLIRDNVVSFISSYTDFAPSTIESAFIKVYRSAHDKSEKELTTLVLRQLSAGPKKRNKKSRLTMIDTTNIPDMSNHKVDVI